MIDNSEVTSSTTMPANIFARVSRARIAVGVVIGFSMTGCVSEEDQAEPETTVTIQLSDPYECYREWEFCIANAKEKCGADRECVRAEGCGPAWQGCLGGSDALIE